MLSKGTKSEEDKRIESIVTKLSSIGFVPEDASIVQELDGELKKIGLTYQELLTMNADELPTHIHRFNFGWNHMEQLADILVQWSVKEPVLQPKAKAIYQYVQNESRAFSFQIMAKLAKM